MPNIRYFLLSLALLCFYTSNAYSPDVLQAGLHKFFLRGGTPSAISLFRQYSCQDSLLSRFPTYGILVAVELYLESGHQPFVKSSTPKAFIRKLKQRNELFQIRNGHLCSLEEAYDVFQNHLQRLRSFTEALGVSWDVSRKDFNRQKGGDLCDWSLLKQMRTSLSKAFKAFKKELVLAYATELALIHQYIHNPLLFDALNKLDNLDGNALPTYVFSRRSLPDQKAELLQVEGLVVMSQYQGLLSSDTPQIRRSYPHFIGEPNALSVFLEMGSPGALVSHEFGHLYFLYHHWEDYMEYVLAKGKNYQIGGHGHGDPNGEAAELAEHGKMPDQHMPWFHRRVPQAPEKIAVEVGE